ncbi:MAG TPA: ATP-binding cassette domain-containing protein, partial [Pyrinomonadaceae bacterium]|nr:ATP-binding cassette domain-containing protein [Pyrinomonadaceae bacterium]
VVGSRQLKIGYLDQKLLEDSVERLQKEKKDNQTATQFLAPFLVDEEEGIFEEQVTWEIEKVLRGLGFQDDLLKSPMSQLSGGWLLRVFIAKALLEKPELLLLDEPTNHLDLSTIQWLENFLIREFQGSLIMITHDVALQRRATDSLAILHGSRFYYQKNLSDYISFKNSLGEEKVLVQKSIESLEKKIEEHMAFVERFRAKAQTAARAQSKLRAAQDLEEEMMALKHRLEQIEGKDANLSFRILSRDPGSKFPISSKHMDFRYTDNQDWLLKNITFDIKRGQKIAIIGDNGTGKTTLLNLLSGRLKPKNGKIERGHQLQEAFFGQHQLEELELDYSLADNLKMAYEGLTIEMGRRLLGAFGFIGDE